MVGIGPRGCQSALARVTIVSWDHYILFDTYIKVEEPVTDYRTFVSGIRPLDLKSDKAISLEDAKLVVRSMIRGKILVGHALKCDLAALGLSNFLPWYSLRDTANYFPFMTRTSYPGDIPRPRKLRDLANDILGMKIQVDGRSHCSYEDAVASIELYKVARFSWESLIAWKVNKTRQIVHRKLMTRTFSKASYGNSSSNISNAKKYNKASDEISTCSESSDD